jgi:uncharacterized protein (DUF1697 family)
MTAHVSLLRGINVGGSRIIKMADLKALYESLGFDHVTTYVQSGNVVFATKKTDPAKLTAKVEAAIAKRFGFAVDVVTRSAAELRAVVAGNPFAKEAAKDATKVVVVFLPAAPAKAERDALAEPIAGPERLKLAGADLYIHYPVGQGRSKLKLPLKVPGTARNWKTVTTLADMAAAIEAG